MRNAFFILFFTLTMAVSYAQDTMASSYTLYVFEGSDWCVNCMRLERDILSQKKFQAFLKDAEITLVRVDFPQRKRQAVTTVTRNAKLAETFNFQGIFPSMYLTDKNANSSEIFYKRRTLSRFLETLQKAINSL